MHIVHGGLLGTWVKYIQNYFYLCPLRTHLQVRPVDTFSRMMAQTTRTRARMCLFGIGSHGSLFRGSKTPRTHKFWGWIGLFKPKLQNRKTCILSKLLYRLRTNFAQWLTTTRCHSWVVPTHAAQIQHGGRPPSWKNRKIAISQLQFKQFRRNLPRWCSSTLLTVQTIKNVKFRKMQDGGGRNLEQIAQLSLTNPRDALYHDKWQNFKTVTWP